MSNLKYEIFSRDFFTCQRCGYYGDNSRLSMAHRIKQGRGTEAYIHQFIFVNYGITLNKKKVLEIIHHPYNLVTACRGTCNDAFNIFSKPVERDNLIIKIYMELYNDNMAYPNKGIREIKKGDAFFNGD